MRIASVLGGWFQGKVHDLNQLINVSRALGARIGPRIRDLFWVSKGGGRKEEGGAESANVAQSHQTYSAHSVEYRV